MDIDFSVQAFSREEYRQRMVNFQTGLQKAGLDGAVLMHAPDIYYLAGTGLRSTLVVPAEGQPVLTAQINMKRTREQSALEEVRDATKGSLLRQVLPELHLDKGKVGVEKDVLSANRVEKLARDWPTVSWVDVSPIMLNVRLRKSEAEIALVRQAARISALSIRRLRELLRAGSMEIELEWAVEEAKLRAGQQSGGMSERGSSGTVAPSALVISGPNTTEVCGNWITMTGTGPTPNRPWGGSYRKLEEGDLVYIDNGTNVAGYQSDEGRPLVVGVPTPDQQRVFDAVLEIQQAAIGSIKPGVPAAQVYGAAKEVALKRGYGEYFMGFGRFGVEYVGHGIGLEINEPPLITPRSDLVLQPGMVLAIEPKLMIPGWGGIGLEDTIAVTEAGAELITSSPRELLTPL